PQLLQPGGLQRQRLHIRHIGQRPPPPQRQRLPEPASRCRRLTPSQRIPARPHQPLKLGGIQLTGRDRDHIPPPPPPPRGTSAAAVPSTEPRPDTSDPSVSADPLGGDPCHSTSARYSAGTTRPASSSSNASTARCFGPPSPSSRPSQTARTGPRTPNSSTRTPTHPAFPLGHTHASSALGTHAGNQHKPGQPRFIRHRMATQAALPQASPPGRTH